MSALPPKADIRRGGWDVRKVPFADMARWRAWRRPFLLDREPKESILEHFDVTVISHYFREFEQELPSYLSQS
jgi:hypothetical protein